MANPYAHKPTSFEVALPAGGKLMLHSVDEVDLWEESAQRYVNDYQLSQQNDLLLLGAILSQQLAMFRAQQRMNGMAPKLDDKGLPTGDYKRQEVKVSDLSAAQSTLGIDKKAREAGGTHTVQNYVSTLKEAARTYGVHLSKRMQEYEKVMMDMRWRLRLLRNGDPEDRNYHRLTPQSVLDHLEKELERLEELDKTYAKEKHRVFLGRVG
jgi:hypothetical protein